MANDEPIDAAKPEPAKTAENQRVRPTLAIILALGFVGYVYGITFHKYYDREIVMLVLGYFSGLTSGVIGFYFGSSAGSEAKSKLLAAAEKKETP